MNVNGVLKWLEEESERLIEECNSNADPYKSVNNSFIEGFNYALANVEVLVQLQLNENQQIVLEWLQRKYLSVDISPIELIWRLKVNSERNGWKARQPSIAFKELSKRQHTEVLQVFSQWAHEQEEEK